MTRAIAVALLVALSAHAGAALASPPTAQPAQVVMLGVFHFANPGRDMVKSGVIDVTTSANQAYLDGLAKRLAGLHLTDVLIECEPKEQPRIDADYAAYVAGTAKSSVNENQQIGYRVAKRAGLAKVTCFDEGDVGWNAEPMMTYIKAHAPQTQASLDAMYQSLSARQSREQATLPLQELLRLANDPARDRENKDLYLRTNDVDAGGGFSGADASASWWHRNFRMYANVQRTAQHGHRVLVVAGQGHTAILKDLLAIDSQRTAIDVVPLLRP